MKLYSDARIRYTLNTAVSIAYTCGNSLKASDFGFVDQVSLDNRSCRCVSASQIQGQPFALDTVGSEVQAPQPKHPTKARGLNLLVVSLLQCDAWHSTLKWLLHHGQAQGTPVDSFLFMFCVFYCSHSGIWHFVLWGL